MSDQENEGTSDGGALRAQLETALQKLKEAEVRIAAAETERTDEKLTTFLSAKNANPGVKEFVPKDIAADSVKLEAWWSEKAALFGGAVGSTDEDVPGETTPETDPAVVDAWQKIQGTSARGSSAPGVDRFTAIDRSLKPDATPEEVYAALKAGGL